MRFNIKNGLNKELYISILVVHAFSIISNILIYSLVSRKFGEEAFSIFSVYKRYFALFLTATVFGIAVALPRQMIVQKEKNSIYFLASIIILGIPFTFIASVLMFFKHELSLFLFDDHNLSYILEIICLSLPFYYYNIIVSSYLRGVFKILESNVLIALTSICILISYVITNNIIDMLILNNVFVGFVTIIFQLKYIKLNFSFSFKSLISSLKKLFNYGTPRIIGDISFESFSTLPVLIITKTSGLISAGYLSLGITLLKIIGLLCSPLTNILLPVVAKKFKEKNFQEIRNDVKSLLKIFIPIGIFITIILFFISKYIVVVFLGFENDESELIFQIISYSALPVIIFYVFKSVNDAIYDFAINSVICLISLLAFYGFYTLLMDLNQEPLMSVLYSLVFAFVILATLSSYFFYKKIKK